MSILDNVKVLLGFTDDDAERDKKLGIIIQSAERRLLAYLPADVRSVPVELEYIVQELAIARFNRLGNETMTSYSQEGESISYSEDDLAPYLKEIQAWCVRQEGNSEGVVMFL